MPYSRLLGSAALAAAALALPATASAATGTISQACYGHVPTKGTEPVVVSLTGGTPGADYQLIATVPGKGAGSAGSTTGTFDAAGNATAQINDVFPPSGSIDPIKGQAIQLSVKDYGTPDSAELPIGTTLITNIAMDVSSKPRNPASARTVTVSGTPFAGKSIYGFVTSSNGKKILKRIYIGRGDVCGYAKTKAVVAPPGVPSGKFRFYIFGGKTLNKKAALGSAFTIYRY
jgi:hypothetical protein